MKILSATQQQTLGYILRREVPPTAREIAESNGAPISSVRSSLAVLERHGCVERRGVSLGGATTWGRPDAEVAE